MTQTLTLELTEEQEILAALQDVNKFEALYERYYYKVFNFFYKRTSNYDDAGDLCSDTFAKAISNLKNYTYKGFPFGVWLFKIARNELYSFYKKQNKIPTTPLGENSLTSLVDEMETEEKFNSEVLVQAIKQLSADDIELIELRFFEKHSYKEIALILEIEANHARIKVFRILKKLKTLLTNS